MKKCLTIASVLILSLSMLGGCTKQQQYTATGAALGAAAGYAVSGGEAGGAVVGGLAGGGVGYLAGRH